MLLQDDMKLFFFSALDTSNTATRLKYIHTGYLIMKYLLLICTVIGICQYTATKATSIKTARVNHIERTLTQLGA
jgi:hypothetical protein